METSGQDFSVGVYLLRKIIPHHFSYIGNKSYDKNLIKPVATQLFIPTKWCILDWTDNDGLYQISEGRKVRHFAQNNQPNSIQHHHVGGGNARRLVCG